MNHVQIPNIKVQPVSTTTDWEWDNGWGSLDEEVDKYDLYEHAILEALKKLSRCSKNKTPDEPVVIMIVGACVGKEGRLVQATFNASRKVGGNHRIFAIDMNETRLRVLNHHFPKSDFKNFTLICEDVKTWKTPEKADLIVSDLLGALGCDRLSPEILFKAQDLLKPCGIMIPSSYKSFLAPVKARKTSHEVLGLRHWNKYRNEHIDSLYVMSMDDNFLVAQPQQLFEFTHPNPNPDKSTERYAIRSFSLDAPEAIQIDGFIGFYMVTLFGNIAFSMRPSKRQGDWIATFFPLRAPVEVRVGETLTANIWRKSRDFYFWYEWAVTTPSTTPIHNPTGKTCKINIISQTQTY